MSWSVCWKENKSNFKSKASGRYFFKQDQTQEMGCSTISWWQVSELSLGFPFSSGRPPWAHLHTPPQGWAWVPAWWHDHLVHTLFIILDIILHLHVLCGWRSQASVGISVTTVLVWSWHCSGPGTNPQPDGPHSSWGTWTQLDRYHLLQFILHHLLTLGHRVELGLELLLNSADLPGPLSALLLSHIPTLVNTQMIERITN